MTALTVEQVECWRRAFQMNIETGELHPDALKLCDLALAALSESRAECERLRKQWLEACDEILAQGHRALAAESREREAYNHLMNLQPHIAQLPERYRPFIDSHVDEAMRALSASAEKEQQ